MKWGVQKTYKQPENKLRQRDSFRKPHQIRLLFLVSSATAADITGTAYVIDGDTIDISDVRIRLNGIDTPEIEQTCITNGLI